MDDVIKRLMARADNKKIVEECIKERLRKEAVIEAALADLKVGNPGDLREAVFMLVNGWMDANGYSKADKVVFYGVMKRMQKARR